MPAWETHEGLLEQAIPYYGRKRFVNISNTKTMYTFFPAMMSRATYAQDNKLKWGLPNVVDGHGGTEFTFNVQVGKGSTFDWVDETTPINVARKDHQKRVTLPWRMCRTHWSINQRELTAARGAEQVTDLMTSRRVGDDQDWADSFEDWGWGVPPASTDTLTAFPLRYWLFSAPESTATSYATAGAAFQGNGDYLNFNHASYTSGPAGLSRVTYKHWGNYSFQYSAFNDALIDKIGHAVLKTAFHAPVDHPDKISGPPERAMYTGISNVLTRAKLARQQNDMNTSDLQSRFSENEIFRIPCYYVPAIDDMLLDGTSNLSPIYGINWSTWYLATKDHYNMKDELFQPDRSAPMDITHARVLEAQTVCCSPRENWVAST
jgi:hypothetical protein